MAFSALLSLPAVLCPVYMPELPWCAADEAESVSLLRRMFSLNTGRPGAQFPCSSLPSHRIPHLETRPRYHCPGPNQLGGEH